MASKNNIELLRQALGAAESSLRLAKQLLGELERGGASDPSVKAKPVVDETPGILGVFDGENMVTEDKKVFPVPANYASKSLLVVGDTLKLIEEGKEKRFKQVDHVKRQKTVGVLAKKDGKWKVVAPEGSYKVLPASVSHFSVDVGSEVVLQIPAGNLTVAWGAIEAVKTPGSSAQLQEDVASEEPEPVISTPVVKEDKAVKVVEKPVAPPPAPEVKKEEPKKPAPKPVKVETPQVEKPKVQPPVVETEKTKAPVVVEQAPVSEVPTSNGEDELT